MSCKHCGNDAGRYTYYDWPVKFWQYICLVCTKCGGFWGLIPEVWWTYMETPWPTTETIEEFEEKKA